MIHSHGDSSTQSEERGPAREVMIVEIATEAAEAL